MYERRRSLRLVPSEQIGVAARSDSKAFELPLCDLSSGGLMTLVQECDCPHFRLGATVRGEIETSRRRLAWEGRIVHHSPTSRGIAVGIAAAGTSAPSLREAVEWLAAAPHVGALQLRQTSNATVIDVIGRLSYEMSHDFLFLVRHSAASRINLSRCTSMDSAGLGMLSIARELKLPIEGARGTILTLLEVARIAETRH